MYTKSMYKDTFSLLCCLWGIALLCYLSHLYMNNSKQLVTYMIVFKYSVPIKNNAFNE